MKHTPLHGFVAALMVLGAAISAAAEPATKPKPLTMEEQVDAAIRVLLDPKSKDESKIAACDELRERAAHAHKAAPILVLQLAGSPELRAHAGAALRPMGEIGRLALAWVLEPRRDDAGDALVPQAVQLLGEMGPTASEALPELVLLLRQSRHVPTRLAVAQALGHIGTEAKPSRYALYAALGDQSEEVRAAAIASLDQIEPKADPRLLRLATDLISRKDIPAAARDLTEFRPHRGPALPVLIGALTQRDGVVDRFAIGSLGGVAAESDDNDDLKRAANVLVFAMRDADPIPLVLAPLRPRLRAAAAASLRQMGEKALFAETELAALLHNPDPELRQLAASILSEIGKPAAPALLAAAQGENANARRPALALLRQFDPHDRRLLSIAMQGLNHPKIEVRIESAASLADFGPEAAAAAPALAAIVQDSEQDGAFRLAALSSLSTIDPKPAHTVPLLVPILSDTDNALRLEAVRQLTAFGPDARAAVSDLVRMVDNADVFIRRGSARALLMIDPDGPSLAPALIAAVRRKDAALRVELLPHVKATGKTKDALAAISVDDPDNTVRQQAAEAVRSLKAE